MARLLFTGGGTGGHIYPAIAIADAIRKRWPETEIRYIGARGGMESRIVPEAGYPFWGISAEGWQGRKLQRLSHALITDLQGTREAGEILDRFQPHAVIGTGGFVALPVGLAAVKKRIPVYIHEQNAFPGITNRIISLQAKCIMLSFQEAAGRFPLSSRKRTVVTGLPIRESITGADIGEACCYFRLADGKKTILAAGGSQGAARINMAMLHVIKSLYGSQEYQVILSCGQRDYPHMAQELSAVGIPGEIEAGDSSNIRLMPYIDRMDLAYAIANLYIGRAGASFLAEITANQLPAILIPLPNAAENHQAYNAAALADKGGAIVIEDHRLTGQVLLAEITRLMLDEQGRKHMGDCMYQEAKAGALDDIVTILGEIIDGEGREP